MGTEIVLGRLKGKIRISEGLYFSFNSLIFSLSYLA